MNLRIFLYVPGMPFDGLKFRMLSLGGSETAGYELAKALAARGHEVLVFCNTDSPSEADGVVCHPIGTVSAQFPFGENFERLGRTIPHDVLIAQRVPGIFTRPWASGLNLWWTHDLATVRMRDAVKAGMWACQGVLCVSEFHRAQLAQVLGFSPEYITVVPNAVDLQRFASTPDATAKQASKTLVYTSRPERGLQHLVGEGGLMERLWKADPGIQLLVAGYENTTPQMTELYRKLWARCEQLPNVQLLGALNKDGVADLFKRAWLHVYLTVRADVFEEVSCISAMEAQAGGTPVVACENGALPETLSGGGARLIPYKPDGEPDLPAFEKVILDLAARPEKWLNLHRAAMEKRAQYDWEKSAGRVLSLVDGRRRAATQPPARLANHLLYVSDILACRELARRRDIGAKARNKLALFDYADCAVAVAEHYAANARLNNSIGNTHRLGDDAAVLALPRCQELLAYLRGLPPGARVLDYACGVGAITVALARAFPQLEFVGADIAAASVRKGQDYCVAHGIGNARFVSAVSPAGVTGTPFDLVLALEVLEHVVDPVQLISGLEGCCVLDGRIVVTVPMGPMEAIADARGGSPHDHLSHFDHHDIQRMFGSKPGFIFTHFGWGEVAPGGEPVGGTLISWQPGGETVTPDYEDKFSSVVPRERVTACLVVKWDADALERCLKSVAPHVDELVIGIDDDTNPAPGTGRVWDLARLFQSDHVFALTAGPLTQGFDAARNETIARATCEWILWIDADEELHYGERLRRYLRVNDLQAYALAQHHFGTEPPGLIKTDLPCRVFRNGIGLKFFGVVHEHPCFSPTQPPDRVMLLPDIAIGHGGYSTEAVRRKRFERNLPLMRRDRVQYPSRTLGKMLWVRDLMHQARFDLERLGGCVMPHMREYAEEALSLWRELLTAGETRLALEALPYVSEAAHLLVGPERAIRWRGLSEVVHAAPGAQAPPPGIVEAFFPHADDARQLAAALTADALKPHTGKYFG